MMKRNDIVRVAAEGWSSDGGGVCRVAADDIGAAVDGHRMPIFVPFAAPGDVLDVRVLKVVKTHAFGRVECVIEPSALRSNNDCPAFGKCGGCDLRHVSYDAELEFKRDRVEQALRRIGACDIAVPPVVPSDRVDGYRNKTIYQVAHGDGGAVHLGFYRRHSHDLVAADGCRIQSSGSAAVAAAYREVAHGLGIDDTRWLFYRENRAGRGQMVIVTRGAVGDRVRRCADMMRERCEFLDGVLHCENNSDGNVVLEGKITLLSGNEQLHDTLCGFEFEISPESFYQVNSGQAEKLYDIACDFAGDGARVLELYCGIGTLSLALARRTATVTGAEIVGRAVDDARRSAARNGVANVEFICGDAGDVAASVGGNAYDVVVVDPPRKGMSGEAVRGVAALAPRRIVYVSCDPATLARDTKALREYGYMLTDIRAVDMFPRTCHVETVVLMERVD